MSQPNHTNFGDYVKRWSHTLKRNVNKKVNNALSASPNFTNTTSHVDSHRYHPTFSNKTGTRSLKGSHTLPKASGMDPPYLIVDLGPPRLFEDDDFYGYGSDVVPYNSENTSSIQTHSPKCIPDQPPLTEVNVPHSPPANQPDRSPLVQSISSMIVRDPDVSLFGTLAVEDIEPYPPTSPLDATTGLVHNRAFPPMELNSEHQEQSPLLDEFEITIRILAEYCFNVAYVTDWMNCDIPPPLAFFETTGVRSPTKTNRLIKGMHRNPFHRTKPAVPHFANSSLPSSPIHPDFDEESPSSSRSPSFTNAAMIIPLRIGPLAQHVMDIYHWEPDNDYSPVDVRVFFLHLKTFLKSLTSMISCYNADGLITELEINPPRFLYIDQFPSATHHLHRLQHIIQAVRSEITSLVEQYPIVATQMVLDPCCCQPGNSPVAAPAIHKCTHDWIRIMIPDEPLSLLRYLLTDATLQMNESDHGLPMDSKSRMLFDRVCQIWRISSVVKNVLLAEWVLHSFQMHPDAKLWPCLATRIDKIVINVRREKATLSHSDVESAHAFIQLVSTHAQSYMSNSLDVEGVDLASIIDVNKHLDTCAHLFNLPPSFQILDSFANGYVRRLLHSIPLNPNHDPTDMMRLISDSAYQIARFVSTLNMSNDLVRNQVTFLLSHTYIKNAMELCPVIMPDTEIWDIINAVCYQHTHVSCVKAMMNSAREYLVDYAQADLSTRRRSFTPDHLIYLEYLQQIQKHLINEKPELHFVWDNWLLSLENEFCVHVQEELSKLVGSDSDSCKDYLAIQEVNKSEEIQSCVVVQLKEMFLEYFAHVRGFQFPNIHHSVRMVKSLTRILTHAITSHAKSCYLHTLNAPVVCIKDIFDTLETQIRELLEVGQTLSYVHTVIQNGLSKLLSDEDMNDYKTPFYQDEVMVKMYISNKPLGYMLEVRADGHLVMTINPASSAGSMHFPFRLERVLELQLIKAQQSSVLPNVLRGSTIDLVTKTDHVPHSSSTLSVTLHNVDFWETNLTFDNVPLPVMLEVQRDDASYVSVYFSQCADGVTQTIDSLLSIVAQKTIQILLDIARQCKKLLQITNESLPEIPSLHGRTEVQESLHGDEMNDMINSPTHPELNQPTESALKALDSLDVINSYMDESCTQSQLTENLDRNLKAISEIMVRLGDINGNNPVLADRLRNEIWKYLTTHLTLDVFKMKSNAEVKERPTSFIEWLNFILIQCCSALYPENCDGSGSDSEENDLDRTLQQSYLPIVLSRYTQNTSVLKEEYLSKITQYLGHISRHVIQDSEVYSSELDYQSSNISKRPKYALFTQTSTQSHTNRSTLVLSSMTLPRSRAYNNICATFGDHVFPGTSNRASLFFKYDEISNLTIPNKPSNQIPNQSHLPQINGERKVMQMSTSPTKVSNQPRADLSTPLTHEQMSEDMFEFLYHYLPTAQPMSSLINPPVLSSESKCFAFSHKNAYGIGTDSVPLSYSLFAILAIIRIRAEADSDLNDWILQQHEVDQLALKGIINGMQFRTNLKSSIQMSPVIQ